MKKTSSPHHKRIDSGFKRCPECFTRLPLNATKCPSCNQKVQEAGKYGLAKKPINWIGYISAIGLWIALGLYIWWVFFNK